MKKTRSLTKNFNYNELSTNARKKEHMQMLKLYKKGSNIANHAWENDHVIDFENDTVIDKGNDRTKKTLKSEHTGLTKPRTIRNLFQDNMPFF